MDRRTFLATLAVASSAGLAAPAGPPSPVRIEPPPWPHPILMGLGDLGAEVIEQLAARGKLVSPWIWNDRPPSAAGAGIRFAHMPRRVFRHWRANIMVPRLVADRLGTFSTDRPVRLVVGLGGEIGSEVMAPLAEQLADRCGLVQIYHGFSGREGAVRLIRTRRGIRDAGNLGYSCGINLWSVRDGQDGVRRMREAVDPTRPVRVWVGVNNCSSQVASLARPVAPRTGS